MFADSKSDTERLFDWAQSAYPSLFSIAATTIEVELPESDTVLSGNLRYRSYPEDIYVGVVNGNKVYVLGGPWPQLTYVDTLTSLMTQVPSETNTEMPEAENCVTAQGYPSVGTKYITQHDSGLNTTTVIESTNTTFTEEMFDSSDTSQVHTTQIDFRLENEYIYISKVTSSNSGMNVSEGSYSPEEKSWFSSLCKGQSITNKFTLKLTFGSIQVDATYLVEIAESKTVPAGTFNTIRWRWTDNLSRHHTIFWQDLSTGVQIAAEYYNKGVLINTMEVTQLTIP